MASRTLAENSPRTDDSIVDLGPPVSSAAYLRAHDAHRLSWTLSDWKSSIYGGFVTKVQEASGMDDLDFGTLWRYLSFKTGAESRQCGLPFPSSEDQKRIKQIAALLPRLVADQLDQDRWSVHEVLTKLQWDSPFALRHSHAFPVDALYESNQETQKKLSEALHGVRTGYVALLGPPGSGKSTLLAAGVIPSPRARVLRYLAFIPGKGQGLGRAESFDFLHDLVRQFKLQGFGKEIVPGVEIQELRMQLERVLGQAAEQYQTDGIRTIIVVDGLDHVPREEHPQRSFLNDFPLPESIPEGVIFLLGTQRLDLVDLPASVRDQASEEDRLIQVSPLSSSAVARLAELAGVPSDVDRSLLYKKTGGHPLAVRYVIDGLKNADGPEARRKWLQEGPEYGGDVDVFYNRAWHDLENNPDAQRGMAYLAFAEGAISPVSLDSIIGTLATDAVWRAANHLLRMDRQHNWSVFHNSFRLFLQAKLSLRHGVPNADLVRARYLELADMAAKAGPGDGQQWLELRYRIRAQQFDRALPLAMPDRFREQFFAGRSPEDMRGDIAMSFLAAKACKSITAVLSLIFAGHELDMRMEVIGDDLIDAYIALGFLDRARGLVDAEPFSMTTGKGFDLVETLLETGDLASAKDLFNSIEPLDVLLGAKEIFESRTRTELEKWAEQALAFRTTDEFITSLQRMRVSDHGPHTEDLPAQLAHLKLLAARGQLMRNPELSPHELVASLELDSSHDLIINYLALKAAFESGMDDLASERLEICADTAVAHGSGLLLQISQMACQLSRDDIAKRLIESAAIPSLDLGDYHYEDANLRMAEKDVILASSLRARFALPAVHGKAPKSALLDMYQHRLENLGSIHGSLLAEPTTGNFPLAEMISLLDFLERAQGAERFDFERGRITRTMDVVLRPMLEAAHAHSDETLGRLAAEIDDRLNRSAQYLTISSFRRVFALEMFQYEDDSAAAIRRIAYQSGREDTPQSEFEEVAKTISAFLQVGLRSEAEKLLACVQTEGLGISRPAKKDGQYLLWEGFLQEANRADPVHRRDRVLLMTRFFSGLAETEGRGVAQRAASTLIREAAMIDAGTAAKVIDIVEDFNLSTWSDIVENIALGAIRTDPTYSEMAALILGRLSIPFDESVSRSTLSEILQLAPKPELGKIGDLLAACVQTDAPLDSRILALETIVDSIKRRGCEADTSGLVRWRAELPPPKSGSSPENPFFLARSLESIGSLLDQHRGASDAYGARSAFLRVLEWADFEAANALFIKETDLNSDEHVIEAMARRSWAEGKRDEAKLLLGSLLKIAEEKGSWGGVWRSQAKLQYHRLARDLGMEEASEAFEALVDDLAAGKESYEYILPDLHEILHVVVSCVFGKPALSRILGLFPGGFAATTSG
jgi:energy-coupling factor transporter ATP-binding protein EcfA2